MLLNGIHHFLNMTLCPCSFFFLPNLATKLRILATINHKQTGNHQRLGRASTLVFSGLKGLVRILRKAVQIKAIVPVGPPNQRQTVWTQIVNHMVEGSLKVFKMRSEEHTSELQSRPHLVC